MKIRWRLALYGAGLTAAALVVFAFLLNLIVVPGVQEDQDRLLGAIADDAATAMGTTSGDFTTVVPPIATEATESDQPFVAVFTETGDVLFTTAFVSREPPSLPAAVLVEALENGTSEATSRGFRYQVRRWDHTDLGAGVAAAGQSIEVTQEQLAGFRGFLVVFALITLLAAAIVAWLVSGRALRPLKELAATADEIGRTGDLSRRLPPVTTDDEVGHLTANFNGMLERLQETREQLQRTLEAQRRFVADASHELRSPLTTIRSNAGFLADREDVSREDRTEAVADIAAEADRMARLVDDLLTLVRADAGHTYEVRPVDLDRVIAAVVRKARNLADRLHAEIGRPATVLGDPDALTQLTWILLDNAEQHGAGEITLSLTIEDGRAVLIVEDEGPGIPADQLAYVFERFHRADPVRSGPGSGLGLAIAETIVTDHGGTITAANRDPAGARLTVSLPLV